MPRVLRRCSAPASSSAAPRRDEPLLGPPVGGVERGAGGRAGARRSGSTLQLEPERRRERREAPRASAGRASRGRGTGTARRALDERARDRLVRREHELLDHPVRAVALGSIVMPVIAPSTSRRIFGSGRSKSTLPRARRRRLEADAQAVGDEQHRRDLRAGSPRRARPVSRNSAHLRVGSRAAERITAVGEPRAGGLALRGRSPGSRDCTSRSSPRPQRAEVVRQRLREHREHAVGEVDARPARARLAVERVARPRRSARRPRCGRRAGSRRRGSSGTAIASSKSRAVSPSIVTGRRVVESLAALRLLGGHRVGKRLGRLEGLVGERQRRGRAAGRRPRCPPRARRAARAPRSPCPRRAPTGRSRAGPRPSPPRRPARPSETPPARGRRAGSSGRRRRRTRRGPARGTARRSAGCGDRGSTTTSPSRSPLASLARDPRGDDVPLHRPARAPGRDEQVRAPSSGTTKPYPSRCIWRRPRSNPPDSEGRSRLSRVLAIPPPAAGPSRARAGSRDGPRARRRCAGGSRASEMRTVGIGLQEREERRGRRFPIETTRHALSLTLSKRGC